MRVAEADREIERIGITKTKAFTIKLDAHAFRLLSSGPYSDKIGAIVREIASNAFDAHVAAKKQDQPFVIHLPNQLEPHFSVRDFGPGMTHDEIETIYSTYFESTKQHSDDLIGSHGLGSKSPIAYTDSFAVTVFQNGRQRSYTIFVGEKGIPEVAMLSDIESTEPQGVEVRLAVVKTADQMEFVTKAKTVLAYFRPRPIILGCGNFEFSEPTVLTGGKGWRLTNGARALAIMGPVAYPIQPTSVPEWDHILRLPLEIDFDIGALHVTTGREDLGYTPKTIAALSEKAKIIESELPRVVQERFDTCASLYEAHRLYGEYKYNRSYEQIIEKMTVYFRGELIKGAKLRVDLSDPRLKGMTVTTFTTRSKPSRSYVRRGGLHDEVFFDAINDILYRDDLPRGTKRRAMEKRRNLATTSDLHVIRCVDDEQWKNFVEVTDGFPLLTTSTLPVPESIKRMPVKQQNIQPFRLRPGAPYRFVRKLEADDWRPDASATGGMWVLYRSGRLVHTSGFNDERFIEIRSLAIFLNLISFNEPIYGLTLALSRKITDDAAWTPFYDELAKRLRARLAQPDIIQNLKSCIEDIYLPKMSAVAPLLDPAHQARVFENMKRSFLIDTRRLSTLASLLGIDYPKSDIWGSMLKDYPLLEVAVASTHTTAQMIADYITMVDAQKAVQTTE